MLIACGTLQCAEVSALYYSHIQNVCCCKISCIICQVGNLICSVAIGDLLLTGTLCSYTVLFLKCVLPLYVNLTFE